MVTNFSGLGEGYQSPIKVGLNIEHSPKFWPIAPCNYFIVFFFLFQLIIGIVGRLIQTAVVTSMDSEDGKGDSVGYLFGAVEGGKDLGKFLTRKF